MIFCMEGNSFFIKFAMVLVFRKYKIKRAKIKYTRPRPSIDLNLILELLIFLNIRF